MRSLLIILALFCLMGVVTTKAQESPYFVTYTHHMEEPGNLDIETSSMVGVLA